MPMRTRSGSGTVHDSSPILRCAAIAASTASDAVANTARAPSPVVFTTWPWCACMTSRRIWSCRASASRIASGCSCQSRVDPSRSVNRKEMVPDGRSAISLLDEGVGRLAGQDLLHDLAVGGAGERLGPDVDHRRPLVRRERGRAEPAHRVVVELGAGPHDDHGLHLLAVDRVVDPVDRGLDDIGVLVEAVLDLERIDVLAAADDQITLARRDEQDAAVEAAEVAGADPATRADRL